MDKIAVDQSLALLNLSAVRYFDSLDSTNLEAARWLSMGAPHLALVLADEQTSGRGRAGRRWITLPSSALAFSLILDGSTLQENRVVSRLTGLGAVALAQTLEQVYGLPAQIKWPNDVLIAGDKVAGVLVETHWIGDMLAGAILGIGINVTADSLPPPEELTFPAGCIEIAYGKPVDRLALLREVLQRLLSWLPKLNTAEFLTEWEKRLAYFGKQVKILGGLATPLNETKQVYQGRLVGLDPFGRLRVLDEAGDLIVIDTGELMLRSAE